MMVEIANNSPLLLECDGSLSRSSSTEPSSDSGVDDDESDTYYTSFQPTTKASASKSIAYVMKWIKAIIISGTLAASILALLPFFMGKKCPSIPSALPFAISVGVIGVLRGIMAIYTFARSIIASERSGASVVPSYDRITESLNGKDKEIFRGQRNLHMMQQCLEHLQLGKATIWGLFIALRHTDLFGVDNPETCEKGVYLMVLITPLITGPILVIIIMVRLISHPSLCLPICARCIPWLKTQDDTCPQKLVDEPIEKRSTLNDDGQPVTNDYFQCFHHGFNEAANERAHFDDSVHDAFKDIPSSW